VVAEKIGKLLEKLCQKKSINTCLGKGTIFTETHEKFLEAIPEEIKKYIDKTTRIIEPRMRNCYQN
jgi:hypothetical protein